MTKTQIKSFFSRLSPARRKQQSNLDDGDEELLEEEHEYRKEENVQEEVKDMFRELAVEHPVFYDGYDICGYVYMEIL